MSCINCINYVLKYLNVDIRPAKDLIFFDEVVNETADRAKRQSNFFV